VRAEQTGDSSGEGWLVTLSRRMLIIFYIALHMDKK
jgi:hypothetical protein